MLQLAEEPQPSFSVRVNLEVFSGDQLDTLYYAAAATVVKDRIVLRLLLSLEGKPFRLRFVLNRDVELSPVILDDKEESRAFDFYSGYLNLFKVADLK